VRPANAETTAYRGRFAPSPSGDLHFGSVIAALGSFLQARAQGGEWLVRIENIDPPREVPGAAASILRQLERLGLCWDGEVVYQRDREEAHRAAFAELKNAGLLYRCRCSRRVAGPGRYPGTCAQAQLGKEVSGADRLRVGNRHIVFTDALRGTVSENLADRCGDFVIWRAENWPAYHLAVVVDDAAAGITEIVRGGDLLDVTARQIYLQQCLGLPSPAYCHLPLALDLDGAKLSKQTQAAPVSGLAAERVLSAALRFLGHPPPDSLLGAAPETLLAWAVAHWRLALIPPDDRCPAPADLA